MIEKNQVDQLSSDVNKKKEDLEKREKATFLKKNELERAENTQRQNNSQLEEEKTSAELFFYPNPATDYIYLKNLATEEAMISIYQIDGVIVTGKQSLHTGIYVGNLASGLYYRDWETDRKSTRLNSSHSGESRMPSSA